MANLTWNFGNTFVLKIRTSWLEKPLRVTINFYKKQYLSIITWSIKYSSKQVITCTLQKKFFVAAPFEGL